MATSHHVEAAGQGSSDRSGRLYRIAAVLWCFLTALVGIHFAVVELVLSPKAASRFVQEVAPYDPRATAVCVAVAWMLLGLFIAMLSLRKITPENVVAVSGFFLVAFLYVNVIRERAEFGDLGDYMAAAMNLYNGEPLHARYLYPPLWANFLELFVLTGARILFVSCVFLNMVSLFVFYWLLHRTLVRYGFAERLAAFTVTGFMVANVPILRTLLFMQVNLHVMNFILASLLLYPRRPLASALAMSLAVHMKASPVVLVLAFLLERDMRWLLYFVLCSVGIGVVTLLMHGVSPYADFLYNARNIYRANVMNYRENSFDSLVNTLASGLAGARRTAPQAVALCKLIFGLSILGVLFKNLRTRAFAASDSPSRNLDNAIPVLLVLMVMASPLVWEHHPVFLSLSYLVLLRVLSTPTEWLVFGFAYFLEFLVPTFDFFPWSFGRLLSPLLWLWLAFTLSGKRLPSLWFDRINDWVARATLPQRPPIDDGRGTGEWAGT
jgi:hypothetical protein